jgi:hypothetical protein
MESDATRVEICAPSGVANLWPEPWTGDGNAHMKDAVENFLNREVCRRTMRLVDAQHQIATDWYAVLNSNGCRSFRAYFLP